MGAREERREPTGVRQWISLGYVRFFAQSEDDSSAADEALIGYYANVTSGVIGIVSELRLKIFGIDWFYAD